MSIGSRLRFEMEITTVANSAGFNGLVPAPRTWSLGAVDLSPFRQMMLHHICELFLVADIIVKVHARGTPSASAAVPPPPYDQRKSTAKRPWPSYAFLRDFCCTPTPLSCLINERSNLCNGQALGLPCLSYAACYMPSSKFPNRGNQEDVQFKGGGLFPIHLIQKWTIPHSSPSTSSSESVSSCHIWIIYFLLPCHPLQQTLDFILSGAQVFSIVI